MGGVEWSGRARGWLGGIGKGGWREEGFGRRCGLVEGRGEVLRRAARVAWGDGRIGRYPV